MMSSLPRVDGSDCLISLLIMACSISSNVIIREVPMLVSRGSTKLIHMGILGAERLQPRLLFMVSFLDTCIVCTLHIHIYLMRYYLFITDILPTLITASQGLTPEKVEGMAVTDSGIFINNDNDGVDDYNGATYVSFIPMIL